MVQQQRFFVTQTERMIDAPLVNVWNAWADATQWSQWVQMKMTNDFRVGGRYENGKGEGGAYTFIHPQKIIRFTWEMRRYKPGSFIEISFAPLNQYATVCRLQHHDLQDAKDNEDSKLGWAWAMDSLQSYLETGQPMTWEEWENKQKGGTTGGPPVATQH